MTGKIRTIVVGVLQSIYGFGQMVSGALTFSGTRITGSGAELKIGSAGGVAFTDSAGNTVGFLNQLGDLRFAGTTQQGSTTLAAATTANRIIIKKTGIADNTATAIVTVTVPNANHAAAIKLTFLSSNGSTDAFESSRCAQGTVVLARTTGANVVAAVAALAIAQIATVAAGATHTLAYDLSAVSGAVGATNTFDIRVTIDDSGNLGSNQIVVMAELINAEVNGVTMAAA